MTRMAWTKKAAEYLLYVVIVVLLMNTVLWLFDIQWTVTYGW